MKHLRLIAVLVLFSLSLSFLAGGSAVQPKITLSAPTLPTETTVFVPPATEAPTTAPPTTEPATEPTEPPTTQPPATEAPTTEAPTQPPTQPTEPKPTKPVETWPPEPWSSQEVTIGSKIPGITAKKAFVYDCETQSYLYMKSEADTKLYPASITKLMNVYTALKYLDKDTVITVSADMLALVPGDTSKAGLYSGEKLTVEHVIKGVLIASGSDAAHILGVFAGRVIAGDPSLPAQEAEDAFVAQMNHQASVMGLVNTHFVNCDGYTDYYHYTCMSDLTTIAGACLDNPIIRETVNKSQEKMVFTNGKTRIVRNTNHLLRTNSAYYRAEACGMKTGTTNAAGACLLSAFCVNGRYMIIGVFGCPTYNSRYTNVTKLFDLFRDYTPPVVEPDPTEPTTSPTEAPTTAPTEAPTAAPTEEPTTAPTETTVPTQTTAPTETTAPSEAPTEAPTEEPTEEPAETTQASEAPTEDSSATEEVQQPT